MRRCHSTLTPAAVHRLAIARVQPHLRLADHGPKCTAHVVLSLVLWAAARVTSLAAACAALRRGPSDQAARNALFATLPAVAELTRRLNRALAGGLPKALTRRAQPVAIDLTLIPYYGSPAADPGELYRGRKKAGTRDFHAYATADVLHRGCRWTVALIPVSHADPWDRVVREVLRQVRRAGVRVRYVLLDRGFYRVAVVRYLQAARTPFVMPVIGRGRSADHPAGPSGTRAVFARRRSGWDEYTLTDRAGRRATVRIGVCYRTPPGRPRWHRAGRPRRPRALVYALWGLRPTRLGWVVQTYRKRYGIETSYRQMNQARVRTSTRSPSLRLLFVGVALLLRNLWAWLHWESLATPRRGGRRVAQDRLRFRALLGWVGRHVEDWLGWAAEVPPPRPLPDVQTAP
jgi:putative transposase